MTTWTLTDDQERLMFEWMAVHTQRKKCPVYKRRKRQEKIRAKGKGNQYGT